MNKNILLLGLVAFYAQNTLANDLMSYLKRNEKIYSAAALTKGIADKKNITIPENPFKHTSEQNHQRADELRKAKQKGK